MMRRVFAAIPMASTRPCRRFDSSTMSACVWVSSAPLPIAIDKLRLREYRRVVHAVAHHRDHSCCCMATKRACLA